MHIAYVFKLFNDLFQNKDLVFHPGDTFKLPQLNVKVVQVDKDSLPTELAFIFNTSLEDDSLRFYQFDWYGLSHKPFEIPAIGQTVELPGPPYARLSDVIRFFK